MALIPNYNGMKFIKETILSFKEGMPNVDVIVVDDCSTDDPNSYLDHLPIKAIYKKNNGGYASAVNKGLKFFLENNYDYVIVANSDILINKNKAHEIYNCLVSNFIKDKSDILGFLENKF